VPDPVRGQVVTQIFQMRALQRLGAQDIADRLNPDPERYPPPQPIPGQGRRAVGAWTKTSILDLLANPKYTGYMVWNPAQALTSRSATFPARSTRPANGSGHHTPPTSPWSPRRSSTPRPSANSLINWAEPRPT
jgi:hypothetical protein